MVCSKKLPYLIRNISTEYLNIGRRKRCWNCFGVLFYVSSVYHRPSFAAIHRSRIYSSNFVHRNFPLRKSSLSNTLVFLPSVTIATEALSRLYSMSLPFFSGVTLPRCRETPMFQKYFLVCLADISI